MDIFTEAHSVASSRLHLHAKIKAKLKSLVEGAEIASRNLFG